MRRIAALLCVLGALSCAPDTEEFMTTCRSGIARVGTCTGSWYDSSLCSMWERGSSSCRNAAYDLWACFADNYCDVIDNECHNLVGPWQEECGL